MRVVADPQAHAHCGNDTIPDFDAPMRVEVASSWQIHGYHRLDGGRAIVHYQYTVS
jgi:hypothetical protein